MVTKVRGNFADFEGTITVAENIAESAAKATIRTASVLLQSWAESRDDPVSHFLMAAACRRSQAVSKTRLTITASGLGCP